MQKLRIADPCVSGEPFVHYMTERTVCPAKEHGRRAEVTYALQQLPKGRSLNGIRALTVVELGEQGTLNDSLTSRIIVC